MYIFFGFVTDADLAQLQKSFGSSNEFIKSMCTSYRPNFSKGGEFSSALMLKEMQLLISCTYGDGTLWGQEVSSILLNVKQRPTY